MKFFILGLGSIGMRHARNLIDMGHEVCGYDLFEEPMLAAEAIGVTDDYVDWDAAVICTPTAQHYSDMVDVVHKGKHVFVEKPLALPMQVVQGGLPELLEEAERKNLIVMVGNMLRFHPNVVLAKQHIKHPVSATFRVKQKNTKYSENVILNWGAHEIDLALYLLGPGKCVDASGTRESASVTIEHDSGVISELYMDYLADPEVRDFKVETWEDTHDINLTLHDWNRIYVDEMAAFVGLIEGQEHGFQNLRCATGADGLAALRIINDAEKKAGL